jgi:hypothetical protein
VRWTFGSLDSQGSPTFPHWVSKPAKPMESSVEVNSTKHLHSSSRGLNSTSNTAVFDLQSKVDLGNTTKKMVLLASGRETCGMNVPRFTEQGGAKGRISRWTSTHDCKAYDYKKTTGSCSKVQKTGTGSGTCEGICTRGKYSDCSRTPGTARLGSEVLRTLSPEN